MVKYSLLRIVVNMACMLALPGASVERAYPFHSEDRYPEGTLGEMHLAGASTYASRHEHRLASSKGQSIVAVQVRRNCVSMDLIIPATNPLTSQAMGTLQLRHKYIDSKSVSLSFDKFIALNSISGTPKDDLSGHPLARQGHSRGTSAAIAKSAPIGYPLSR
jgi:hypothetical protein